ncbi:SpoIIE family protein phosphatase [Streptomyces sp. NPDC050560]|uniref:SpoIIE family protein phosphatase n=1 Tax=Streptomyces sp. NPDC050560 TaxID=3365630 RepID=UPI00378DB484
MWRWDETAGTVAVDAEAGRMLGLPAEAAVYPTETIRARFHPVDWNEIDGIVRLAIAEGTLAEGRLRVVDPDGTELGVVRSRSRPVVDPASNTYELIGMLQEVAEQPPGPNPVYTSVTGDWRRSREAFLLDAGRALAEARSTQEVLEVADRLSMPGFSPDGLAVFGITGDRLVMIGSHGHGAEPDSPVGEMPLDADYPGVDVVRTGRAVYLSSPQEYRKRYPAAWQKVGQFRRKSWAFLPLIEGGRPMGAWLAAFSYPVQFTPDERSVLATVARMLAQALSRAGVADSQRELTEGLQHTMMPTLGPEVPGMSVAARYVPTGRGLQVGGDWYDMISLPSGRFAFVIGDVQGHDVRAAALMGQLRIALRAYASEGHRPDAVLTRASRFLSGITESVAHGSSEGRGRTEPGDDRFATCLYVEADPATGMLEIARAGHPDPAVRMADGTVINRPTRGGLPLGIDPDSDYPTTRFVLEEGQTMLLCTDGLIENGGHDLDTGWSLVRHTMEEDRTGDLERLVDALVGAVHGPDKRPPGPVTGRREDDIAVLLLHRSAPRQRTAPVRRTALTVAQAEPQRIASARQQLRELLHDWADDDQIDSAALLASEVLTNVLVHTDGDALLVAQLSGEKGHRRMRVEVTDRSDDLPHKQQPGEMASSGRGLVLMELLARNWGVSPRGEGKSIWFELREGDPGDDEAADAAGTPGEGAGVHAADEVDLSAFEENLEAGFEAFDNGPGTAEEGSGGGEPDDGGTDRDDGAERD